MNNKHIRGEGNKDSCLPSPLTILDTPVHPITVQQTLEWVTQAMACPLPMARPHLHQIATTNPEFVMRAQWDGTFRQLLWQADLCIPDGIGLVLASRWMKRPLPQRVPGSSLTYKLATLCAQNGWSLFLLGAAEGVAEEAGAILQQQNPALQIAGTYAGSPSLHENDEIVARINASQADMLWVAYGAPKQDFWIQRNKKTLTSVRVAMGIGGSLDFITGNVPRAPQSWQRLHLEWLYRLYLEPHRWRRMLALPHFVWRVIWQELL